MSRTIDTKVLPQDKIAMHDPVSGKYWHYATPPGFALPLVCHDDPDKTNAQNEKFAFEHFQGVMARRCPPPCMMGALNNVFSSIATFKDRYDLPEPNRTRLHVILGDPGVGKTELANVLSDALGWDAFTVPPGSGGNNLDELIKETRFGNTSAVSLIDKVNQALVEPTSYPVLVDLLDKQGLLSRVQDIDGGKTTLSLKLDTITEGDGYRNLINIASVAIPTEVNSSSPISYGPGRLLKKLIEAKETGRPTVILIDEINRYKNFGSLMQNLYEVVAGTRDQCTLVSVDERGNPKDYTFTRKELENVMIIGTGNIPDARKEPEARQLSDSLESRIGVSPIEMRFTATDYAHRLCQEHLGLALTTYYEADRTTYENDPAEAAQHFQELLSMGRTEAAEKAGSPHVGVAQLFAQSGDVMTAAQCLGNVYYGLQEICAGRVDILKSELRSKQLPPFGPRQIQNPLAQWAFILPSNPDIEFNEPPSQHNLGTRMTNALLYWVNTNFPERNGFEKTRNHIGELLISNRIISAEQAEDMRLTDTNRHDELIRNEPDGPKVAELMNVSQGINRHEELLAAQQLLHEIARQKWPDEYRDSVPDTLFTQQAVMAMLDEYRANVKEIIAVESRTPDSSSGFVSRFVPELDRTPEGGFALKVGRNVGKIGATNHPRLSINEQLMNVIASSSQNDGSDVLSDLFMKRPLSEDVEQNLARKPPALREAYRQELQGISDGTHISGTHMTTIETESLDGRASGFIVLRDLPRSSTGEILPPQYTLIGEIPLSDETASYLAKLNINYINKTTNTGKRQLDDVASTLVEAGAERMLAINAEERTPPGPTDEERDREMQRYAKAWDRALSGGASSGLFDLSRGNRIALEGSPLLKTIADSIAAETSPEVKARILLDAGGGIVPAARLNKPGYQGTIEGIKAQVAFTLQHGEISKKIAVTPTREDISITR